MQSPDEALNASSISAGWTEWLRFREKLDIAAQQMGLTSYRQDPQVGLRCKKKRHVMMQMTRCIMVGIADMLETDSLGLLRRLA